MSLECQAVRNTRERASHYSIVNSNEPNRDSPHTHARTRADSERERERESESNLTLLVVSSNEGASMVFFTPNKRFIVVLFFVT